MWLLDEPNQPYEGKNELLTNLFSLFIFKKIINKLLLIISLQIVNNCSVSVTTMAKKTNALQSLLPYHHDLKLILKSCHIGLKRESRGKEAVIKCHPSHITMRVSK